jgi:hypothetical protein
MANASGFRGPKQSNGYFVPLGDCTSKVYTYSGGSGAGGSSLAGSFVRADWATPANANSAKALLSSISSIGQGGLLRDMGRTVVSSNRTFRKVQLVAPNLTAAGVASGTLGGTASTTGPYLTGYIELATGNNLTTEAAGTGAAPVAYLPGAMM